MMHPAGDLGLLIDFGDSRPGLILQRRMLLEWYTYLVDGEPLIYPFDIEQLPPGIYRLRSKERALYSFS